MKKVLHVILFISILFSCQKATHTKLETAKKLINTLDVLPTVEAKKQAYALLQPSEQRILWEDHLNKCIESGAYSSEQINLISETLSLLNKDDFQNFSVFISTKEFAVLQYKIVSSFSVKEKYDVFGTLNNPKVKNINTMQVVFDNIEEESGTIDVTNSFCTCSIVDDWCFGGNCRDNGY